MPSAFRFDHVILGSSKGLNNHGRLQQFFFAAALADRVTVIPFDDQDLKLWESLPPLAFHTLSYCHFASLGELTAAYINDNVVVCGSDDRLTGFAERMGYAFMFSPLFPALPQPAIHHLPSPKKIAIVGPECTGKSTLAKSLATVLGTICVPEYVRLMLDFSSSPCVETDLPAVIRGQVAMEFSLAPFANGVLFCDTEPRLSCIWADTLYGRCAEHLRGWVQRDEYETYLLTAPDLPWESDGQRCLPEGGVMFFDACHRVFKSTGRPLSIISGHGPERLNLALRALENDGIRTTVS